MTAKEKMTSIWISWNTYRKILKIKAEMMKLNGRARNPLLRDCKYSLSITSSRLKQFVHIFCNWLIVSIIIFGVKGFRVIHLIKGGFKLKIGIIIEYLPFLLALFKGRFEPKALLPLHFLANYDGRLPRKLRDAFKRQTNDVFRDVKIGNLNFDVAVGRIQAV
jgi:hypothetical protein